MSCATFEGPEPLARELQRVRPDRCPGVVRLHEAADGALARVRLPGGRLTAAQLGVIADVAEELGNGLVDLTSRANLQLRGLGRGVEARLASRLGAAGLLPSPEHDGVRNVLASPLAGRACGAIDDVDAVVALLDERLRADEALAALPGRFCFLVDDGSGIGAEARPDVTVIARGGARFGVLLDRHELAFEGNAGAAVGLALDAATAFIALADRAWRIWELPGVPAVVAERLRLRIAGERRAGAVPEPVLPGISSQRDGRCAVTVLASLAQLGPVELRALAAAGDEARLSQRRTISIVDLPAGDADGVLERLGQAGLVLRADSAWTGLTACAGTGRCPHARGDVRAAAAARAAVRGAGAPAEHWTACERRCGERPEIEVTVSIEPDGSIAGRTGAQTWTAPSLAAAGTRLGGGEPAA